MIITKNTTNNVVASVIEETTLTGSVYYLFEFLKQDLNQKFFLVRQVNASYSSREGFTIIEPADIELDAGDYILTIYQQASSSNINPALTTPALYKPYVHTEKLTVIDTVAEPTQYQDADLTNTSFEG